MILEFRYASENMFMPISNRPENKRSMVLGKNASLKQNYDKKAERHDSIDREYIAINPDYRRMAIVLEEAERIH